LANHRPSHFNGCTTAQLSPICAAVQMLLDRIVLSQERPLLCQQPVLSQTTAWAGQPTALSPSAPFNANPIRPVHWNTAPRFVTAASKHEGAAVRALASSSGVQGDKNSCGRPTRRSRAWRRGSSQQGSLGDARAAGWRTHERDGEVAAVMSRQASSTFKGRWQSECPKA
jgi:hypothetical protein